MAGLFASLLAAAFSETAYASSTNHDMISMLVRVVCCAADFTEPPQVQISRHWLPEHPRLGKFRRAHLTTKKAIGRDAK
ncbi:hypothetical protein BKA80DRAFT_279874 [Phyllosticta citrichinensis]